MGRPDQGNKAQTPVGCSHDTGVSTGPGYGSYGGSCSGYSEGSRVCVGAGDSAAGAAVHELRRPLGTLHGVGGVAWRPRKRRSVRRGLRRRDGHVGRMVGVLGMAWRSGSYCFEGYAELQVTVYWGHGGMRGGSRVHMVGVPGKRGGTWEPCSGGAAESHGGTGVSP